MRQTYEEGDVEEILKRAVAIDATRGRSGRDSMIRAAGELGISEETVVAAERQWMKEKAKREEMREFIAHQRNDFWGHLACYVGVNTLLLAFNFAQSGRITWAIWPLLGWGLGIFFHMLSAFDTKGKEFRKEFQDWKKGRESDRDASAE
ncbi:MAG: 2TM domain-containing protein [Armatimonadetes bacterium]|nr:2TM domain-containing protein [Armatimonadota bacterium]